MDGRRFGPGPSSVLVAAGVALLLLAAVHHFLEAYAIDRRAGPTAALVLDGAPALGVAYAGYRLSDTDLAPAHRWTVTRWSLAGGALFATVLGATIAVRVYEGRPMTEPIFPLLVAAEAGTLAGFVAGYNTARAHRAGERLRAANERLEAANRELETSNERLEQFAYALSHDLQEPLRSISNHLHLLERRHGDDLDDDAREFVEYAVDGAERMQELVKSLLEYSRAATGEQSVEETDANAVLQDVLDDLRVRIEETDATVTSDDLPTVRADPDQLAQVFRNLVSNALRHGGDEPPRVHVGVERRPDVWEFSVRDEGVGIEPADQDRIFGVFEQVDDGERTAGEGGVGLALCERLVERHGGDIWVASEPGEGATFSFTLPADDRTGE